MSHTMLKWMQNQLLYKNVKDLIKTPIIIIGAGPAAQMSIRTLIEIGFDANKITVLDKTGRYNGI